MSHEFEKPPKREEQTWKEYAIELSQNLNKLKALEQGYKDRILEEQKRANKYLTGWEERHAENKALKQRILELCDSMQLIINYRQSGGCDENVIVLGLQYDHPLSPKLEVSDKGIKVIGK